MVTQYEREEVTETLLVVTSWLRVAPGCVWLPRPLPRPHWISVSQYNGSQQPACTTETAQYIRMREDMGPFTSKGSLNNT